MTILLLGKDGQLGWELQRSLSPLAPLAAFGRAGADFEDPVGLRDLVAELRPAIIVNAAAYTAVDKAEREPAKAFRINAEAVGLLAEEAAKLDAWMVHYSTDYVFDGAKASPYGEDDATDPLSVYGRSKRRGEQALAEGNSRHLIFRTSWVFAARGANFAKTMLRLAAERDRLDVVADQHGAPTSAELVADLTALAVHRLLRDPASGSLAGTYHLAAAGETSWHGYARFVLERARAGGAVLRVAPDGVRPIPARAYPSPARRPANSRLDTSKLAAALGVRMPDWRFHVARLVDELVGRKRT
ncbi:MAG: dTDP-4-dehydrorhamnose reductase [Magnetospirillum sp.]|nr:dTDP-4-dehydrorhamnose reductase [Magnetospirillum sp.]